MTTGKRTMHIKKEIIREIIRAAYTRPLDPFVRKGMDGSKQKLVKGWGNSQSFSPIYHEYACFLRASTSPYLIDGIKEIPYVSNMVALKWNYDQFLKALDENDTVGIAHTHSHNFTLSEKDKNTMAMIADILQLQPPLPCSMVLGRQDQYMMAALMAFEDTDDREGWIRLAHEFNDEIPEGRDLIKLPCSPPDNPRENREYIDLIINHFADVTIKHRERVIGLYDHQGQPLKYEIVD